MEFPAGQIKLLLESNDLLESIVTQGKLETLQLLFDSLKTSRRKSEFKSLFKKKFDDARFSRLLYTAGKGQATIFEMLLDLAAQVNFPIEEPIKMLFSQYDMKYPLSNLAHHDEALKKLVSYSIEFGMELSSILRPHRDISILLSAAYAGNSNLVQYLFKEADDFDVDPAVLLDANTNGTTPLHAAASSKCSECVASILKYATVHGLFAQLYLPDASGENPLHIASRSQDLQSVRVILNFAVENKVDATRLLDKNNEHQTALFIATEGSNPRILQAIYDYAIYNGKDRNIQMLQALGPYGHTPMHRAALAGNVPIIDILLTTATSNGIDASQIMIPDFSGRTPLYLAVQSGSIETVRAIIKFARNRKLGKVLLKPDHQGRTPLHVASASSDLELLDEIIKLARESGCNLLMADTSGSTPYSIAFDHGHRIVMMRLAAFAHVMGLTARDFLSVPYSTC